MAGRKKQVSNAGDATTATPATIIPDVTNVPIKSPYELAVEAGYTGTEEQFNDPESVMDNPVEQKPVEDSHMLKVVEPVDKPETVKQVSHSREDLGDIHKSLADNFGFKGTQSDLENLIKSFNPDVATGKYIVAKPFKDAAKHLQPGESAKLYAIGEDVSFLDSERLIYLENKGLVTKISD